MRQKSDLENAITESLKAFERQREEEEKKETHKAVLLSIQEAQHKEKEEDEESKEVTEQFFKSLKVNPKLNQILGQNTVQIQPFG